MAETTLPPYANDGYTTALLLHSHGSGMRWYLYNTLTELYRPATTEENNSLNSTGMINNEVFKYYDMFIMPPGMDLSSPLDIDLLRTIRNTGVFLDHILNVSASPVGIHAVESIGEAPDYVAFGTIYSGTIGVPYRYDGKFRKYAPNTGKELDEFSAGSTQRAGSIGGTFRFDLPSGVNLTLEFTKELLEQIINSGVIPEDYKMAESELRRIVAFNKSSAAIEDKGIALGETATQTVSAASTTSGAIAAKIDANKIANSIINSAG